MAGSGWRKAAWVIGGATALAISAFFFVWWRLAHPATERLALPERLVAVDSPAGRSLLAEAEARADHAPLARWFVAQDKLTWCGPASATTVLNALGLRPPEGALHQRDLLSLPRRLQVTFGGMTLDDLHDTLEAHGARAEVQHADDVSLIRFRMVASANLADPSNFLIVNYDRGSLGQAGQGHISPVAAWDRDTDRYLVLDTAAYRYPWTWVRGHDLWSAMNTVDPDSGKRRGFVHVDAPQGSP